MHYELHIQPYTYIINLTNKNIDQHKFHDHRNSKNKILLYTKIYNLCIKTTHKNHNNNVTLIKKKDRTE